MTKQNRACSFSSMCEHFLFIKVWLLASTVEFEISWVTVEWTIQWLTYDTHWCHLHVHCCNLQKLSLRRVWINLCLTESKDSNQLNESKVPLLSCICLTLIYHAIFLGTYKSLWNTFINIQRYWNNCECAPDFSLFIFQIIWVTLFLSFLG